MSDENKIRDAADAIKGVVEAIPIYQDIAQPAAKEIGTALQTVTKTIHIALAPISALVWGYDKIKDYLDESLTERLKHVPSDQVITPNPTIAGPAVEALRFSAHEPALRELYANLLATAMDKKKAQEAHPAFVEILRQLTPDEALLLKRIARPSNPSVPQMQTPFPLISGSVETRSGKTTCVYLMRRFSALGDWAGCSHTDLMSSYIDNLCRLGLTEIFSYDHFKQF